MERKFLLFFVCAYASIVLIVSTVNSEEIAPTYELKLDGNNPDVRKFAEDGWSKVVDERSDDLGTHLKEIEVRKAQVQVVGTEKRYTILVYYYLEEMPYHLMCILFVRSENSNPIFIKCYETLFSLNSKPCEKGMMEMYHYFYHNI
ncbi:Protein of unknown function [Cotesia congregata]|uniref:Uncharacterized protein n=1 Tax=Cotesia congregata TaxID=51543 RepID=A0A8J2H0B4_COTCN|nr:Protein of unknown function [Cotesia congregata]